MVGVLVRLAGVSRPQYEARRTKLGIPLDRRADPRVVVRIAERDQHIGFGLAGQGYRARDLGRARTAVEAGRGVLRQARIPKGVLVVDLGGEARIRIIRVRPAAGER